MPNLTKENTAVIACSMLKGEIEHVMREHHMDYPVYWVEKGLHEFPEKLKRELVRLLPEYADKTYIILAYGMCGYAVFDLTSETSTLAIPCFDDCVRMLMSREKGAVIPTKSNYMYLTEEWINSDRFMFDTFEEYKETYGEEKAEMIIEMMIGNYEGVAIMDDGTFDADACYECMCSRAAEYDLTCKKVQGTLRVLEKLLKGEWDEEIVVKQPGEKVCMSDFDGRPRCE